MMDRRLCGGQVEKEGPRAEEEGRRLGSNRDVVLMSEPEVILNDPGMFMGSLIYFPLQPLIDPLTRH